MGKYTLKHGFTLVELLIVVVVITILAAIATVSYNGISTSAIETAVRADINALSKQLELFKVTNGRYPTVPFDHNAGPALELEQVLRSAGLYEQTRTSITVVNGEERPTRTKSFIFCASPDGSQITVIAAAPILKNISSSELEKAVGKKLFYYSSTSSQGETTFQYTTGIQDTGLNICGSVVREYDRYTWPRRWSFDTPTKDAQ